MTAILALAAILAVLCCVAFVRWHYSEPQRRKRAVRELVKRHG